MPKTDEIPRGQLSIIILSTLIEGDKYGYEIINEISEKTNGNLIIKQPSLYSSLRRMEEQNLISSYWRDSELGGRRHYYSITDFGKKHAEKWQSDFFNSKDNVSSLFNDKNNKQTTNSEENVNQQNIDSTNSEKISSTDEIEDNNNLSKPTMLQQENLFNTTENIEKQKQNEIAQIDNSFIQYDLFSAPTFISKPSVEVFDTIKNESTQNQDAPILSNKNISDENKEIQINNNQIKDVKQNEILTAFEMPKNKFKELENINIKQEFMLIKNRQKSFIDSYKSQTSYFSDLDNTEDISLNEELNSLKQNLDNQFNKQDKKIEFDIDSLPTSSLPPIIQNTFFEEEESVSSIDLTKIKNKEILESSTNEDISISQEKIENVDEKIMEVNDSLSNEQLNNSNENIINDESEKFGDAVFLTKEEKIINANNSTDKIKDNITLDTTAQSIKDDAVYITEKPDPNALPKVRKIAPSRFEIHDYDKLPSILSVSNEVNYNNKKQIIEEFDLNDVSDEIQESFVAPQTICTDYEQLKSFYDKNDIRFQTYEKLPKTANKSHSNFIKYNKLKLVSSFSLLLVMIIQSVALFFCFNYLQPHLKFMFYLPSCFCLIYAIICTIIFTKNQTKVVPKASACDYNWFSRLMYSLLAILFIFAINLLCGMTFENISSFGVSLTYLSILTLNYPLMCLINYIIIKTNRVNF